MSQLPFGRKRVIIAIAFLPALAFLANQYFKWLWLGGHDGLAGVIAFFPLILAFLLLNPSEEEIRAYRDERERRKASRK